MDAQKESNSECVMINKFMTHISCLSPLQAMKPGGDGMIQKLQPLIMEMLLLPRPQMASQV
jgi:hypothetical protein